MKVKNGDIVYANINLINGIRTARVCLVINYELFELIEVFNITTKDHKHIRANKLIKKNNQNNLNDDSYVKTDHRYKISISDINNIIGYEKNYSEYL